MGQYSCLTLIFDPDFVPKTPEAPTTPYDLDGNLIEDGRWIYTWDAENRLKKMESKADAPTGSKRRLEFEYDFMSRQIKKISTNLDTSVADEIRFVYDGWNLIAELNSNLTPRRSYTWGLDLSGSIQGAGGVGGLLVVRDHASGSYCFPAYDGNGNAASLVKATTGNTTAAYEYGPFGELFRITGAMAKANPFRFSTKYTDEEAGILYYGYRYYNGITGRWLSRDPIGEMDNPNLYSFIQNAPLSALDALGLATYRLEVVVGDRFSSSGAGRWSQPAWAGDGDSATSASEAWSKVTVSNTPWIGVHPRGGDYCNTVDYRGDRGDAGEIRVYVADPCGGKFRLEISFSTYLYGEGPIKVKSQATLRSENRVLWFGKATGTPRASFIHHKVYTVDFRLAPNREKMVVRYTPIIAFPVPPPGQGFTTGHAHGYIGIMSLINQ